MRNFVREEQKLPLFGIGPYLVYGMVALTAAGIVVFSYILKIGILSSPWVLVFRLAGLLLMAGGAVIWFIGALRSEMDESIIANMLKTDGIYAHVRNPMYSGIWIFSAGISLMWHNVWLLVTPVINWAIMTIVLKNTEEKWLLNLYGEEYANYKKRVNRCIPWKSRK